MRAHATAIIALVVLGASAPVVEAKRARPMPRRVPAVSAEHLRYRVTWNDVPVARAELSIRPQTQGDGVSVALDGRAETNEVLDLLWRMRDGFEATVATAPIAPKRFVLRQHENDRRRETSITADAERRILVGSYQKRGRPPKAATVPLEHDVHDPASLAYLIRTHGPDLRGSESYRVFSGSRTYDLTVAPIGDESIMTIGRSWRSRKLRLALRLDDDESSGARQPRVQEATLWVSSGPERLPLRMQSQTYWGWVVVELVGRGRAPSQSAASPIDAAS